MKIKQRLRINIVLLAFSIAGLMSVLAVSGQRILKAMEQNQIAEKLMESQFERLALRTEYMRTGDEQVREKVREKNRQVGQLLALAQSKNNDPEIKTIITGLFKNQDSIGEIFRAIMANRQKIDPQVRNPAGANAIEEGLVRQLNEKVFESVRLGVKLQEASSAILISTFRIAGEIIVVILLLVGGLILINSTRASRFIAGRIDRLREGALTIGAGDLDHRIGIKGNDELAELSTGVDEMTAKLKASYDILKKEVEDRKRAEEALQESEERFRVMFESHGAAMLVIEPGSGHIINANEAAIRFYGYSREQFREMRIDQINQLLPEEIVAERHAAVEQTRSMFVFPHRLASGEVRFVEVYSSPVAIQGRPMLFSIIHDITERKRMEEKIRESRNELEIRVQERTAELKATVDRLEKANQELEEFAYIASHDLQEPLRKIQTFGDMAKKRCSPNKTGQDYLEKVLSSAGRMRQLLQELLMLSRVTSKKEPYKKIDLAKTVQEAADVFEAVLKETGGRITIESLPTIEADESQIRQLFQNLIGNGLKFQNDHTPFIRIYGQIVDQNLCQIVVKDNGIGFDQEYAEIIFKPFERLQGRSAYEGTGMGLAICRKIVERHGGTIRAESRPGEGAAFFMRLPLRQTGTEVH